MDDDRFMRLAIEKARQGISAGQTPFGAVIVRDHAVVASTHNTVWKDCDPSAHGEINAIREAARALSTINLGGCTIYSTCEPCPMCLAAIHWSKMDRLVYGASIADAAEAGFSELKVEATVLARMGGSPLKIDRSALQAECRNLFALWKTSRGSQAY